MPLTLTENYCHYQCFSGHQCWPLCSFLCLASCTQLKLFQPPLVCWNLFPWLKSQLVCSCQVFIPLGHNPKLTELRGKICTRSWGFWIRLHLPVCQKLSLKIKQMLRMSSLREEWQLLGEDTWGDVWGEGNAPCWWPVLGSSSDKKS